MSRPPSKNKVTAEELARLLGLSQTTVSFVLNGQAKEKRVSTKTVQRVQEAAARLNYVPNELARSLRRQNSQVIGIMVHGLGYHYIDRLIFGMLPVFDAEKYTPFLAINYRDLERERREFDQFTQRQVDGVICLPTQENRDLYLQFMDQGIPLVFIADIPTHMPSTINYVVWDQNSASRIALGHLIETGRRRIAYLSTALTTFWSFECLEAYHRFMREAGLQPQALRVTSEPAGPEDRTANDDAVRQRLSLMIDSVMSQPEPPEAFFCPAASIAIILLDILEEKQIQVPGDIAVMSLTDLFITKHRRIGLSTVWEPLTQMGRAAAQGVIDLIRDPNHPPVQVTLPAHPDDLRIRQTTALANCGVTNRPSV